MAGKKFVLNDILCADSRELAKHVKPNSVALTITSPPYRNAINYSEHIKHGKSRKYRGTVGGSLDDYLDDMEKIFSQVRMVTITGGVCCIVIADELDHGVMIPLPSLLLSRLVKDSDPEDGWHMRDMIIWNKITAGRQGAGNRFSVFVKTPVPTRYRANIMHEYIIILQKGREKRDLPSKSEKKIPLNRVMKRQVALSVWDITPVPPNVVDHPAVFPEQIPWRLINLFSFPGETVLDPMCGSGQTTKVAKSLNRKFIGVDLRKEYASLAKKRLKEKLQLSNFMVPLFFPVKWSKAVQPGGKDHASLDVEGQIPKGYRTLFQKITADKEYGTKTTHIYYKNKKGEYLTCVISAREEPFLLGLGKVSSTASPIGKVFKSLPKTFELSDIKKNLPKNISGDILTVIAIADVLEHEKMAEKKSKHQRIAVYSKTKR